MADEIKATVSINVENGTYKTTFNPGELSIDQTTQGAASGILSIGTTEETVSFTDVSSEGVAVFQNLDATNFINVGPDSTGIQNFLKIKAGEHCFLRLHPGITVKAKADTAACKMYFLVLED